MLDDLKDANQEVVTLLQRMLEQVARFRLETARIPGWKKDAVIIEGSLNALDLEILVGQSWYQPDDMIAIIRDMDDPGVKITISPVRDELDIVDGVLRFDSQDAFITHQRKKEELDRLESDIEANITQKMRMDIDSKDQLTAEDEAEINRLLVVGQSILRGVTDA